MKNTVSIVIPVYNVEKYLRGCLESVISQTYKNTEIILVDDGSTDRSSEICKEYAEKYLGKIIYVRKENGGVSSARNIGIEISTGKYISFVDSDDKISKSFIADSVNNIIKYKTNFVCCQENLYLLKCRRINKNSRAFLRFLTTSSSYAPYAKLFDSSIIKKNSIRFNENLRACEDCPFIRQYLKYCDSISFLPEKYYFYNNSEGSLSKKGYINYCVYFKYKLDVLHELFATTEFTKEEIEKFISYRTVHGIYVSLTHYYRNFNVLYLEIVKETLLPYITNTKSLKEYSKWYKKYFENGNEEILLKYFQNKKFSFRSKVNNFFRKYFW